MPFRFNPCPFCCTPNCENCAVQCREIDATISGIVAGSGCADCPDFNNGGTPYALAYSHYVDNGTVKYCYWNLELDPFCNTYPFDRVVLSLQLSWSWSHLPTPYQWRMIASERPPGGEWVFDPMWELHSAYFAGSPDPSDPIDCSALAGVLLNIDPIAGDPSYWAKRVCDATSASVSISSGTC